MSQSPNGPNSIQIRLEPPRPVRPRPRPVFWLFIFGVVIPVIAWRIPGEISGWYLASALRNRDQNNSAEAYRRLEQANYWTPDRPLLLLQRAEWELADGKNEEALADCEKMLAATKGNYSWLTIHANFLQHAGKFTEAVEDWKRIDQLSLRSGNPNRAIALNGIAYARALAKSDLEEALKNANEALDLAPDASSILDTRGFIRVLLGDSEGALEDLNKALLVADGEVAKASIIADKHAMPVSYRRVVDKLPKRYAELLPPTDQESEKAQKAFTAAVMHYHRSLAFDALGQQQAAAKDRAMVKVLIGRDPDETLF